MATAETLDDRLQKFKDELKIIYSMKFDETKGGKDDKREACCAIHDQLKPSKLFPSEFSIDSADRDGRNDPKTDVASTSDLADAERKATKANPMATPEKTDHSLQEEQDVVAKRFEETPDGKDEKRAAGRTHDSDSRKATARQLEYPTPKSPVIKSGQNDKEGPKEESPSESPTPQSSVINFKSGRNDKEALKEELCKAVESVARDRAARAARASIKTFVNSHIHEMLGPVSVSLSQPNLKLPQYISCTLIELSLAGQVVWETEDGKAAEGTTDFWKFKYSERRLIEASLLHSCIKSKPTHVPRKGGSKNLLPVMYWKKEKTEEKDGGFVWVEYDPVTSKDGSKESNNKPGWATEYLKQKNLDEQMMQFSPDIKKPFDYHNSVYLLLCRFNGEGVPEEARVQAYAGKATKGVEKRWLQHAGKSAKLIKKYNELLTFSESPLVLGSLMLVDVVIGRLYAQWGRTGLIENDTKYTEHDNIALFVYRAYGPNAEGDNANTKEMEKTEGDLIRGLKLTKMECGMNGTEPKDKENEAENAKNAEDGDI